MGFFKRLFGVSQTKKPRDHRCWRFLGKKIELDLNLAPELSSPGGALRLEAPGLPVRVLLWRDKEGDLRAWENRCAHMGRRIDPVPGADRLMCCSIGKSTYELDGRVVSGLAKGDIRPLKVVEEDGTLTVFLSD